MGIEQADTPDSMRRALERPSDTAGHADPVRTDPERQTAAHRLYRDLVDHVYGKTHDAWVQGLPDLRATWGKIEEKYPERTRLAPRTVSARTPARAANCPTDSGPVSGPVPRSIAIT